MDIRCTLQPLSDTDLDLVCAGHGGMSHRGSGSGSEVGSANIGEIIIIASGNAQVTVNVIGANYNAGGRALGGHHRG